MAGARMGMQVDAAGRIGRALSALIDASNDMREPFEEIGAALVASVQQRFEDEEDPEGDPWKELADATQQQWVTKRRRRGPDHILQRQGYLAASITYAATAHELEVGSHRVYAAIHQLGGTSDMAPGPAAIPARPFLGISQEDEWEMERILADHLQRAVERGNR